MKKFGRMLLLLSLLLALVLSLAPGAMATSRGAAETEPSSTESEEEEDINYSLRITVKLGILAAVVVIPGLIALLVKQPAPAPAAPRQVRPSPAAPVRGESPGTVKIGAVPQSGGPSILCQGGPLKGRSYPVAAAPLVFGRSPDCAVNFPMEAKGISRIHCQVSFREGRLTLTDLGATYGTYVTGGRLRPNTAYTLRDGESFYLGEPGNSFTVKIN